MDVIRNGDLDGKRFRYRIAVIVIGIIVLIIFSLIESLSGKAQGVDENQGEDVTDMTDVSEDYDISGASDRNICYENRIAITFDDGPKGKITEELLDGLEERGVKATFFLIGESAEKYPEVVKRMYDAGHLIGSHTYSHVKLCDMSTENALEEIKKANSAIEGITGVRPKYIRPPYGMYSEQLLMSVNMTPVLWTVDPNDWNTTNAGAVVKKVVSKVKCGDIILLHDIYPSSVAAALEIIDQLKAKGYIFVTVDQILLD